MAQSRDEKTLCFTSDEVAKQIQSELLEARAKAPYLSEQQELAQGLDELETLVTELATTLDGTKISTLGKGLPSGVIGTPCPVCDKKGYIVNIRPVMTACTACNGRGVLPRILTCRPCGGSGRFTQRRTKKVVKCRVCWGEGKFPHQNLTDSCKTCGGYQAVPVEGEFVTDYIKCSACEGIGEIKEKFNPLFSPDIFRQLVYTL